MKDLWKKLNNLGIKEYTHPIDILKIKLLNQISIGMVIICTLNTIFLILLGFDIRSCGLSFLGLFFPLLTLYLSYKDEAELATKVLILGNIMANIAVCFLLGLHTGLHYIFLIYPFITALLLNKNNRFSIFVSVICLVAFIGLFLFFQKYDPLLNMEEKPIDQLITFSCLLFMAIFTSVYYIKEAKIFRRSLEEHIEVIDQKNEELSHFSRLASHDMREPLRTIKGFSELLDKNMNPNELVTEKDKKFVSMIKGAAFRMDDLLEDLLTYIVNTEKEIKLEKVDLNQLVKSVCENMYNSIEENRALIEFDQLPVITSHKNLLSQVVQNIISNGIKYQPIPEINQGGVLVKQQAKIKISVEKNPANIILSFTDNGIGIQSDKIKDLFKPFSRLHSHQAYEGTGLGLASCKKIVNRLGGNFSVESEPGKGSTFRVILPAVLA